MQDQVGEKALIGWQMSEKKEQITIKKLREIGRTALSERTDYNVAALETDLLLSKAIGEERLFLELNPYREVLRQRADRFLQLIERRKQGCPVAYLLGYKEFMGYDFWVDEKVLIPRDDTEVLIELTSDAIRGQGLSVTAGFEVGVGTGVVSLTLLSRFRRLTMMGADINDAAIEISQKNALYLDNQLFDDGLDIEITERYEARASDLFSGFDISIGALDFIVSNPPYIASEVIETLDIDVKDFEPRNALDGGRDGMDLYRRILSEGLPLLREGGFVVFEIGYDQGDAMYEMLSDLGMRNIRISKDLAGNDRAILGYKQG